MGDSFDIGQLLEKMRLAAECGHAYELTLTSSPPHSRSNVNTFNFVSLPDKRGFSETITRDNHFEVTNKAVKMIQDNASKMFDYLEEERQTISAALAKVQLSKSAVDNLITNLL